MNDDELRAALARRASGPLSADDRMDILRSARVSAVAQPRRPIWPRLASYVVGTVAVVVLVIIALPILLSPPSTGPSASPGVDVLTTQQLIDLAQSGSAVGRVVIADATIVPLSVPNLPPTCDPAIPCPIGQIGGEGGFAVTGGYRDTGSTAGDPVTFEIADGWEVNRWITTLTPPSGEQRSAFLIMDTSVEYLGPAQLAAGGRPLAIADLPLAAEKTPTDNVYVVHGWWWSGMWPNCPAQPQSPPVELDFYCNGFWLTPDRPDTTSTMVAPQDGLLLNAGPYPAWSDQRSPGAPVEGTYVVRSAGCQITLDNRCPVWRLVGRLDDQATTRPSPPPSQEPVPPTATPEPSATSALPIADAQTLANMIGDPQWVDRVVLADITAGEIQPIECPPPKYTGDGCDLAMLKVGSDSYPASDSYRINIGLRDATSSDGFQQDDGNGYRWVKRLAEPNAGVYAFVVGHQDLELLGPVVLGPEGGPADVTSLLGKPVDTEDAVFAVTGWLTQTYAAPCPEPSQDQQTPRPNIWDYYCSGSWLTPTNEPSSPAGIIYSDGLHVQGGAYNDFAIDPQPLPQGNEPGGYQPRQGIYLIRNAGCPEVVTGDCPVWRMVGRLDDGAVAQPIPAATPTPIPTSTSTPTELPTRDAVQYVALPQALELAQGAVNQTNPQLRSYAPGSYQSVWQILLGPNSLTELPEGLTGDTMVWGVQFVSKDLLTTVFVDLFTGDILDVNNRPMPADPTPIHKSDIVFGDPTVNVADSTTLEISAYLNDQLAADIPPGKSTQIDPYNFGPAPWTVTTTTSSGRQLTTGVLDPKSVWGATGDYPLESQSFGERVFLSCGQLTVWAGGVPGGPAPGPSYPSGDCDP